MKVNLKFAECLFHSFRLTFLYKSLSQFSGNVGKYRSCDTWEQAACLVKFLPPLLDTPSITGTLSASGVLGGDNAATSRDRNRNSNLSRPPSPLLVTIYRVISGERVRRTTSCWSFSNYPGALLSTLSGEWEVGGGRWSDRFAPLNLSSRTRFRRLQFFGSSSRVLYDYPKIALKIQASRRWEASVSRKGRDITRSVYSILLSRRARRDTRPLTRFVAPAIANVRLNRGKLTPLPRSSASLLGTFQGTWHELLIVLFN